VPSNDSDFFERGGGGAPRAPRLVPHGPASRHGCGPRGACRKPWRRKAALRRARSEGCADGARRRRLRRKRRGACSDDGDRGAPRQGRLIRVTCRRLRACPLAFSSVVFGEHDLNAVVAVLSEVRLARETVD